MKIIDRYVLALFLRFFLGGMALLVSLFVVILFFDLVGEFINNKAPFTLMAGYFAAKLPEAAYYMAPMAVLAAAILSLSMMTKDREVMVLMSCGVSSLRIAGPIIAGTVIIAALAFADSEYLMPRAFAKSEDILRHKVKKMGDFSTIKQNMLWVKSGDLDLWNIGFLDLERGFLHGVNIMRFTPDRAGFDVIITAKKGWKTAGGWTLADGRERAFRPGGIIDETPFKEKTYPFTLDFKELKHAEKIPQEMNFAEITSYIEHIRKVGYEDTRYTVDRYVKITFPLISVVMAFIAIPFGLRAPSRAGGALGGITLAVTLGFGFWFIFSMAVSLGHSGKLPPLAAAGGAHLLFLGGAAYALLSQGREGLFR